MFESTKARVRRFRAAPRGKRFRAHHERLRKHASVWRMMVFAGAGLVLLAVGLVLLVLPGPGLLVAAIGAALIAGESRAAATLLDRIDAWLHNTVKRWRGRG